jgi:hypothetical protein
MDKRSLLSESGNEMDLFEGEGDNDKQKLLSVDDELEDDWNVSDDEFEDEDKLLIFDVEKHAKSVVVILKPVSFTMALVVWMVRLIHTVTVNVK